MTQRGDKKTAQYSLPNIDTLASKGQKIKGATIRPSKFQPKQPTGNSASDNEPNRNYSDI
ncbi:hypothetical protein DPMN_035056 [Dreissena polymorpha]|uniref:Uncharacterized protein n=2 Tax=Dreissena polymorpha TaxID=45954 RepID=A0A9D4MB70_DREPO|nr:hypothetical protein DPMN_035056 [Dreissena polymorpha]